MFLLTASIAWSYTVVVTRRMGLAQMEVNEMNPVIEVKELSFKEGEQRQHIRSEVEYIQWLLDKDLVHDAIEVVKKLTTKLQGQGEWNE